MNSNAASIMTKARTKLILEAPFFGALALRLKLAEDATCKTMWTDGVRIGYSPVFVQSITFSEVVAVLVHEVMHCACLHPYRRGLRDVKVWNVACDKAINPIIKNAGYTLPKGCLYPDTQGMSAEWYYDREPQPQGQGSGQGQDNAQNGPQNAQGQSGQGKGQGKPQGSPQGQQKPQTGQGSGQNGPQNTPQTAGNGPTGSKEPETAPEDWGEVRDAPDDAEGPKEGDWAQAVQQAAVVANGMGKLPAHLRRFAEEAAETRTDWRSALRRFMHERAKADYSWRVPNRRYMATMGMYLPALRSESIPPCMVVVDTSGSIDDVLVGQFENEINAIADEVKPERIIVVYADAKVQRVDEFGQGEIIKLNPVGGGGTDFRPAFKWLDDSGEQVACVVYLTDLLGKFPDVPPDVPTLWASTTKRDAPFGETIYIQH